MAYRTNYKQGYKGNTPYQYPKGVEPTPAPMGKLERTHIRPGVIFVAFNKHIATEIQQRYDALTQNRSTVYGTPEQDAVWQAAKERREHLMINACAGSGKTFTLIELMARSGIMDVQVMTYHRLGLRSLRKVLGNPKLDEYKTDKMIDAIPNLAPNDHKLACKFKFFCSRLVSLAKQYGVDSKEELERIVGHHGLELEDMENDVIDATPRILQQSVRMTGIIDFDDMIWLPSQLGVSMTRYELLLADECQDLSRMQHWLTLQSGDRVVAVGDVFQSIYAFRGADSSSMPNLRKALEATERGVLDLPLTLTRRCPKAHVAMANHINQHIRAMDEAPEGKVSYVTRPQFLESVKPGDMVLCRVNGDLITAAYKLLKLGIKAVIRGRDIGMGIKQLVERAERAGKVDKFGNGSMATGDMIREAGIITDAEVVKLLQIPNGRGQLRAANVQDRFDCLVSLSQDTKTSAEVKQRVDILFSDTDMDGNKKDCVVLGSIHRMKGLEANRVYILRPDLLPHPMAHQEHEKVQELNIAYVAVTRAKFNHDTEGELVFVGGESGLFSNEPAEEQQEGEDNA